MNPGLELLQPYPFERLRALTANIAPAALPPIALTIGEPQHAPPQLALDALMDSLGDINKYPATAGSPPLRQAIGQWLAKRFKLPEIDWKTQIVPVNGTREALFALAQTLVAPGAPGRVISPNPFYQIYEGAALLAGTSPTFVDCDTTTGFLPNFESLTADQWQACELLYICSPGNPSGAVIPQTELIKLMALAEEHNFVIVSDECYSEIYRDEDRPPVGLLQAAAAAGNTDFNRCLAFHSLSKRSNLPGLRSGFVAGDAQCLAQFMRYRTYHGCAMPPYNQAASIAAWCDEDHVRANRQRYREKFDGVLARLGEPLNISAPEAGFYLWPQTPIDDEQFTIALLEQCNVAVLPGRYLGRESGGHNPGSFRVRLALVAEINECLEAAERIAHVLKKGL